MAQWAARAKDWGTGSWYTTMSTVINTLFINKIQNGDPSHSVPLPGGVHTAQKAAKVSGERYQGNRHQFQSEPVVRKRTSLPASAKMDPPSHPDHHDRDARQYQMHAAEYPSAFDPRAANCQARIPVISTGTVEAAANRRL